MTFKILELLECPCIYDKALAGLSGHGNDLVKAAVYSLHALLQWSATKTRHNPMTFHRLVTQVIECRVI